MCIIFIKLTPLSVSIVVTEVFMHMESACAALVAGNVAVKGFSVVDYTVNQRCVKWQCGHLV